MSEEGSVLGRYELGDSTAFTIHVGPQSIRSVCRTEGSVLETVHAGTDADSELRYITFSHTTLPSRLRSYYGLSLERCDHIHLSIPPWSVRNHHHRIPLLSTTT